MALLHIREKIYRYFHSLLKYTGISIRLNLNIYPLYCTVEKLRGKKYHLRVARAVSKKIPAEDAACKVIFYKSCSELFLWNRI